MTKRQKIEAELRALAEMNGGVLNPRKVVEFARDPKTELHARFQWDDTRAAEQYRLDQARAIIRVHIEFANDVVTPYRVYTSLPSDRSKDGGYRRTVDVMVDEERRQEMLSAAMRDLATFRRKYIGLTELAKVLSAAEEVIQGQEPGSATG